MHYTVYKIENKINGKCYIGKHKTTDLDDDYFGSGSYLNHAIDDWGIENFEKTILCLCSTESDMNMVERAFIAYYIEKGIKLYNIQLNNFKKPVNKSNQNTSEFISVDDFTCDMIQDTSKKQLLNEIYTEFKNVDFYSGMILDKINTGNVILLEAFENCIDSKLNSKNITCKLLEFSNVMADNKDVELKLLLLNKKTQNRTWFKVVNELRRTHSICYR